MIKVRNPQTYARIIGALLLLTSLAGFFGEAYVPSKLIVSNNPTATAANVRTSNALFRLGFATYLIEALCDVTLALLFYALLRPVHHDAALLAAFMGLMATALFAVAEFFYFASTIVLTRSPYLAATFRGDQIDALALLSLRLYGYCGGLFMIFYGVASVIRGYLMFRSGYLPKFLGVLLMIAGCGFIGRNVALVLAPKYVSDYYLLPMFATLVALTVWFLTKGVDVEKWNEKAA